MGTSSNIRLRPWAVADSARLFEMYRATPDLDRQLPPIATVEDASDCLERHLLPATGRSVWAIELDGAIAGCVSVAFMRDMDSVHYDRGWVSYWSSLTLRGQGVTRTAVRAVCDWVLGHGVPPSVSLPGGRELDTGLLAAEASPGLRRLELGYRTNNPASGAIARYAGFSVEGVEREKFLIRGEAIDAVVAGRLATDSGLAQAGTQAAVHHLELWTADYSAAYPGWDWLLQEIGLRAGNRWEQGMSWVAQDGSYIVLEESPDTVGGLNRCNPGMNHLALNCSSFPALEKIRSLAGAHGWQELYAEKYPHAGGEGHTALYLVNQEGFEVELVVAKKL